MTALDGTSLENLKPRGIRAEIKIGSDLIDNINPVKSKRNPYNPVIHNFE